jgi:hypothetical protein
MSDTDDERDADSVYSQSVTGTAYASTPSMSMAVLPKPKRWSPSETEPFFTNIVIRTCLEIHESGRLTNLPAIHAMVIEGWHKRLSFLCPFIYQIANATAHPLASLRYFDKCSEESHLKPYSLLHPSQLWKHTAFENEAEYKNFQSAPHKLGKPSVTNPLGDLVLLCMQNCSHLLRRWNEAELPRLCRQSMGKVQDSQERNRINNSAPLEQNCPR